MRTTVDRARERMVPAREHPADVEAAGVEERGIARGSSAAPTSTARSPRSDGSPSCSRKCRRASQSAESIDRYPAPKPALRLALARVPQIGRLLGTDVPSADVERILSGSRLRSHGGSIQQGRGGLARDGPVLARGRRARGGSRRGSRPPLRLRSGCRRRFRRSPGSRRRTTRASPVTRSSGRSSSGAGFAEAVTFTFIEEQAAAPFASIASTPGASDLVPIANPLSELVRGPPPVARARA